MGQPSGAGRYGSALSRAGRVAGSSEGLFATPLSWR